MALSKSRRPEREALSRRCRRRAPEADDMAGYHDRVHGTAAERDGGSMGMDGDAEALRPLRAADVEQSDGLLDKGLLGKMQEESLEAKTSTRQPTRVNLYFSVFVVNLLFMCTGQCYVWTSPTLPYLQSVESFLLISAAQGSVVASVFVFGGALGALLTRPLADSLGHRRTMALCLTAVLASWLMLGLAADVRVIYAARLLTGVAAGVTYAIAPIYTAEISDDSVRGALNSIPLFSRSCGYVFVYSVGPYVSYHRLVTVAALCPLVCLILLPLIAESPHYLLARGHRARAVCTVQWLRGGLARPAAEKEVDAIQEYINETVTDKKSLWDLVATVGNIRALYVSGGLLAFQQLSGVTVIVMYTQPIFQLTGGFISPSVSAILIGTTMLVSSLVVPPFIKRWGFIKPMIVSALGCALFVGLLGLYFFLKSVNIDVSQFSWLPVTSLFLYTIFYTIGIGTLPWAVMGEMFPANTKSLAAGILTSFNFLLGFLTTVLFVEVNDWAGICWSFWFFALCSFVAAPFTRYLLPDTQGLSLDQIQRLINMPWNTKWSRRPELVT